MIADAKNLTMDDFCQSPVTTNTQGENANTIFTSERRNTLDMLAETIKVFTIDSTINDSAYYDSDKDDAENDSKSDPLVAAHTSDGNKIKVADTVTTNRNSPQKLLINRTLLMIVLLIYPRISDRVAAVIETMYARQTPALKVIAMDMMRSGARVFWTPADVSRHDTDRTTPRDSNTSISSPRFNSPVFIGGDTTVSPTRTEIQEIGIPKGPTGSVEVRNTQPFNTSINGYSSENGDTKLTFSKLIGR